MSTLYRIKSGIVEGIISDNESPLTVSNDVFQIRGSNTTIKDCLTLDTRGRISAHCDHIQIIPTGAEPNAQYFGATVDNIHIIGGGLDSDGSMQGIFIGDGGISNIHIENQVIRTQSQHVITLCGVFSGTFLNNLDKEGKPLNITLEPIRLGGGLPNNFYILSFKDHAYEEIHSDQEINDLRQIKSRANAQYVENFDLYLWREISESFADEYAEVDAEYRIQHHFDKVLAEYEKRTSNTFQQILNRLPTVDDDQPSFDKLLARSLQICEELKITLSRQIAYILATIEHETARTFEPVVEAFWLSEEWRSINLRYYPWHGRGFIQLTWEENYTKIDKEFGLDGALLKDPELMISDYDFSLLVSIAGMKYGWYTGKSLDDYISNASTDFYNARRIVNGTDKASEIGNLAEKYLQLPELMRRY